MGMIQNVKEVGVVGALRRSPASMAWVGLQEVGRMVKSPRLYFSDIKPHASKQAVIVVDALNGFLGKDARLYMKDVEAIFPRMNKVIDAAREEGIPVIYLSDGHSKKDKELAQWPEHCLRRTWEGQVHQEISQPKRKQEWVFKTAFSAFETTNLDEILEKLGVEELIILGVATEYCDEANSTVALGRTVQKSVIPALDFAKAIHLFVLPDDPNINLNDPKFAYPEFKPDVTEKGINDCDISDEVKEIFRRALKRKYKVTVVSDSIREVDLTPGDGDKAVWRMAQKGIRFSDTAKVVDRILRREYKMPLDITPTDFKIGPSISENARPIVNEEIVGSQHIYKPTLNYRVDPLKAKLTQTDFYQLVMANLFRQACMGYTPTAHFEVFIRNLPVDRNFMVFSGLQDVLHWLLKANMDKDRIDFVLSQPILKDSKSDLDSFRDYLVNYRSHLDVWSFREGDFFMPLAPYMGISGPIEEILLGETHSLGVSNSRSAFSTRAAQYRLANPGIDCIDMSMRRIDPGIYSEIAAFEAWKQGWIGTSNTEAAFQYGITPAAKTVRPIGTNSHAMYMGFDTEIEAIRTWMDIYPNFPMTLTCTYHTLINAIKTAMVLKEKGLGYTNFRIDTKYLAKLTEMYQRIMNEMGFETRMKVGSSDLFPVALAEMFEQETHTNAAGIGTNFGQVPSTPGVLKLSEIDGPNGSRFICKLSIGGKDPNLPGIHQVWRKFDSAGHAVKDTIALLDERVPNAVRLMKPFTSGGYLLNPYPTKEELREQFAQGRNSLPEPYINARGRYVPPEDYKYPVELTPRSIALREKVVADIHEREIDPYLEKLHKFYTPEELAAVGY